MKHTLLLGDCAEKLKEFSDNSFDSLVTDPPAGINILKHDWDSNRKGRNNWISWLTPIMQECLRVIKPGSFGFVWALPKNSHWTVTAVEDAGFEIKDIITHHFASGMAKSPNTLKPASEHWILCRKPTKHSMAANLTEHGVGQLNIDAARIAPIENSECPNQKGRYPSNVIFSHNDKCTLSGTKKIKGTKPHKVFSKIDKYDGYGSITKKTGEVINYGDSSGMETIENWICDKTCPIKELENKSRYFYCIKPSKKEKNLGTGKNTHPTIKPINLMSYLIRLITPAGGIVLDPFMGSGSTGVAAIENNYSFAGIEQNLEYYEIARNRIQHILDCKESRIL